MSPLPASETFPCPCCGKPMQGGAPARALSFVKTLTRTEKAMLMALADAYPRVLTAPVLIDAIWGDRADGGPLSASGSLGVMQTRINRKIKRYGWKIAGIRSAEHSGGRRLYAKGEDW